MRATIVRFSPIAMAHPLWVLPPCAIRDCGENWVANGKSVCAPTLAESNPWGERLQP
jgi:hypothetical protein